MRTNCKRILTLLLTLLMVASMLLATACGKKPVGDESTPDLSDPGVSDTGDSTTDSTADGTTDSTNVSDTTGDTSSVTNGSTNGSTGSTGNNTTGNTTTNRTTSSKTQLTTSNRTSGTSSTTKTTRPSNISTVSRTNIINTTKPAGKALVDKDFFMSFFNECVSITDYKVTSSGSTKTSANETVYLYFIQDAESGAEYCMHLYCDKDSMVTGALLNCARKNYEFMFAVFSFYIYQSLNLPEADLSDFLDKFEALPAGNVFDREEVGVYEMACYTPDEFVTFAATAVKSSINSTKKVATKLNESKCEHCVQNPERITNYMAVTDNAAALGIRMDMLDKALVNLGNQARLAKVMNKAKNGEDITYVSIGGSVTEGAYASDYKTKSYAGLTHAWLKKTFPQSNVKFVNAGIGGTSSLYGVHRVQEDVLSYDPDFVIIEFGVNDTTNNIQYEAYASLLRRVMEHKSQPAVLLLFVMGDSGGNQQSWQQPIGQYYDLPMISYRDAVWPEVNTKNNIYGQYLWSDIGADYVHPTDKGHAIIGDLIISYLQKTYENLSKISTNVPAVPAPERPDNFKNAKWYNNTNITPQSLGSFSVNNQHNASWKSSGNKPIVFKFTGKRLIIPVPSTQAENLDVSVRIDGGKVVKLDIESKLFGGGRYTNFLVFDEDTVGEHTVEITCNSGTLYLGGLFVS